MKKGLLILLIIFTIFIIGCTKDEPTPEPEPIKNIIIEKIELLFDSDVETPKIDNSNLNVTIKKDENDKITTYTVTITPNEGYEFDPISTLVEWKSKDSETAIIENTVVKTAEIVLTIKKEIEVIEPPKEDTTMINAININFESKNNVLEIDDEHVSKSMDIDNVVDKEENKEITRYQILLTPIEGFKFDNPKINWQKASDEKAELTHKEVTSNRIILIYEVVEEKLYKIEINLDTTLYEVSSDSEFYNAEIVKPLDYLYIITKVYFNITPASNLEFIVNGNVIENTKYKIEFIDDKYVLTYKIDDPNWTPYY